jgi:hypothetical protein
MMMMISSAVAVCCCGGTVYFSLPYDRPNSRDPEITLFDDLGGLPRVFLRKSHPNQPRNKPEQPTGALGAPQHALLHLSDVTSPHTQSTARAKYR